METGEVEDERGSAEAEEDERRSAEEEEEEKEEATQDPTLEQLQSEVKELRGQLAELELEKEALMKKTRSLEDRQVKNWKWIQEATKFSGSFSLMLFYYYLITNSQVTILINESLSLSPQECRWKSAALKRAHSNFIPCTNPSIIKRMP
jgi:predicted nuclease with TOPRIM domain